MNIASDLLDSFSANELSQFFRNVIEESYTEGILCFFIHFSTTLSNRKNGSPLYLITFFNEVVLTCIINKFQSECYFKITSYILNLYLYVIHFEKKCFSEYYDLVKSLHKVYLKLKKPLYNDREILNFLDNLKMNYAFLSDPSEKSIESNLSKAWKLKITEEIVKSLPKHYLDIETPNNNIKYKGLKNLGNSIKIYLVFN